MFLYYVNTKLMPADPVSRLHEVCGGDRSRAHREAVKLFSLVRQHQCLYRYGRVGGFKVERSEEEPPLGDDTVMVHKVWRE